MPRPGRVALTFDDGPDPTYTRQVLDILDRYGVKATFFIVGEMAREHPELVREVSARGHNIANHSWSHPQLARLSGERLAVELDDTSNELAALAYRPRCLRPPFGSHDAEVDAAANERGMEVVMWEVDPSDWAKPGASAIESRVLGQVRPGARILMHDGGGDRSQTVAALPRVIEGLRAKGFEFDAICGRPRAPRKVLPMVF